eukprot:scaffold161_cov172-Amphora_coffeaeformis.AAC.4
MVLATLRDARAYASVQCFDTKFHGSPHGCTELLDEWILWPQMRISVFPVVLPKFVLNDIAALFHNATMIGMAKSAE